jgi:hypothetical protein
VLQLAGRQHGVVTRAQLVGLGLDADAIKHRLRKGRLHQVWRGVYAVGRPELTRYGTWMAAVLGCGPQAVLSDDAAAELWEIRAGHRARIEVSVPVGVHPRPRGIVVHRRAMLRARDITRRHGIPVTTPIRTLVDLATRLSRDHLEAAINEADKHGLVDPEALRRALGHFAGQPGVAVLRRTLDRRTFTMTDTELERRFLPIVRKANMPQPQTQV